MKTQAWDGTKVPEKEWDSVPQYRREPYVEFMRKGGFVYAAKRIGGRGTPGRSGDRGRNGGGDVIDPDENILSELAARLDHMPTLHKAKTLIHRLLTENSRLTSELAKLQDDFDSEHGELEDYRLGIKALDLDAVQEKFAADLAALPDGIVERLKADLAELQARVDAGVPIALFQGPNSMRVGSSTWVSGNPLKLTPGKTRRAKIVLVKEKSE